MAPGNPRSPTSSVSLIAVTAAAGFVGSRVRAPTQMSLLVKRFTPTTSNARDKDSNNRAKWSAQMSFDDFHILPIQARRMLGNRTRLARGCLGAATLTGYPGINTEAASDAQLLCLADRRRNVRLIVSDLAARIHKYTVTASSGDPSAAVQVMNSALLGEQSRPKGLMAACHPSGAVPGIDGCAMSPPMTVAMQ